MVVVNALTVDRMILAESNNIIGGYISGNDLILVRKVGSTINAGRILGAQGTTGVAGAVTTAALNAAIATEHSAGAISATELATFVVTSDKLAAGAVTTTKIINGSVTAAKLASNSIVGTNFTDNSITEPKFAFNAVSVHEIADGAVANADFTASSGGTLASGAIHYYRIGDWVIVYTISAGWVGTSAPVLPNYYRPTGTIQVPCADSGTTAERIMNIYNSGTIDSKYASQPITGSLFFSAMFRLAS